MAKKWTGIVIHCSDSSFGDSLIIDQWHKQNGWSGCGYHLVITNGYASNTQFIASADGQVHTARSLSKSGAHAKNYNSTHIGICLIGKTQFSHAQFDALATLIKELMEKYQIPIENVIGHNECSSANGKTCPNFNVQNFIKENIKNDPRSD